jgi:dTDP-glucose 4,6-dehydratase
VIPAIISQALTKSAIHLGNLTTRRDFTYVSDTVRGFLRAAETEKVEGQVFHLGTGQEITIGDLAQKIIRMVGRPVELTLDPERLRPDPSEVMRLISDPSRATECLGWEPEVALEDGLEHTVDWVRQHLDLYRTEAYEF